MYFSYLKIKNHKVKRYVEVDNKSLIPIALSILIMMNPLVAHAQDKKSVSQALQPLIDVLRDLAEPVSYGFMIKGFMQIMAGNEHSGKKTIKYAAGGYLGIQFIPQIFQVLKGIKLN